MQLFYKEVVKKPVDAVEPACGRVLQATAAVAILLFGAGAQSAYASSIVIT